MIINILINIIFSCTFIDTNGGYIEWHISLAVGSSSRTVSVLVDDNVDDYDAPVYIVIQVKISRDKDDVEILKLRSGIELYPTSQMVFLHDKNIAQIKCMVSSASAEV